MNRYRSSTALKISLPAVTALLLGGMYSSSASAAVTITDNRNAFTDTTVINLTAEGTAAWLTWNQNTGDPTASGPQVRMASPTTPITYSEIGTNIPASSNGGWRDYEGGNHIDRTWTNGGTGEVSGSAGNVGPFLAKYNNPEVNPSILQFDLDLSALSVGDVFEANYYFSTYSYRADITASLLDDADSTISGETDSSFISTTNQGYQYHSFTISGTVVNGAETLRLQIEPDTNDGVDHHFHQTALTMAVVPEPASLSLLALGGLAASRRRRQ